MGLHVLHGGAMPNDLFETELARRMGWTLSELDEQDMGRVLPGLHAAGTRDALEAVLNHVRSMGKMKPTDDDLRVYNEVTKLMKAMDDGRD